MNNIDEKEQFVRPVKLDATPLSYSQIISELRNVFYAQRDIDKHLFNRVLENSRFKTNDFLEQNPVTYTCELLREILLHSIEQEKDEKLKAQNKRVANKSVNHIKDLFLNINYENKTETMYVFFAYILGMLESLDLTK